ncbi:MAG: N-6 DNA methylase, partial [Thiomargarita sp.]|nr:N-6 DNA methylase [Thiomargarita sp.]
KVADTHGIVYTPQPIVDFMIKSVNELLEKEFGKKISSQNVHFLDPFVGTGNFIVRIMHEISAQSRMALSHKFKHELHCNEVMLLPYYIASMNIEHEYLDLMAEYEPFQGICLADTFELAENKQANLFVPENTERVKRQKETDFTVVIGNPPYNAGQANENDNNKNRKYETIDARVKETYSKDSKSALVRKLFDPYVKAIRWASDRIGKEGIVALVTNNSFIDSLSFDGMRKHLEQDFSKIYILDLKGNVRKDSMRDGISIGEKHTVFGLSAMVGISITFFVKCKNTEKHEIFYSAVDWKATRQEKFEILKKAKTYLKLDYKSIQPDKKNTWLTEGLHPEFDNFLPLGTKEAKKSKIETDNVVFKTYSLGIATNRDSWVYNLNRDTLANNIQGMIDVYNEQVEKWAELDNKQANIDDFVLSNNAKIKWSLFLKNHLKRGRKAIFSTDKIRTSLYRPFTRSNVFFDRVMNDAVCLIPKIFPTPSTESKNMVICVSDKGSEKPFMVMIANYIVDLHLVGAGSSTQSFPLYTYT